jgi:hypothetical protein
VNAFFRLTQVSDMRSPLGKVLVHPNELAASELRTGKSNTGRRQAAQRPQEEGEPCTPSASNESRRVPI